MTWTKEQKQAYDKQYAKDNKEKLAAYHRKWYQDNKDGLVAEYREANKERAAKRTKAYRAIPENKKKAKAALKKWEADNKDYRKAYKKKTRYTIGARFNKSQANAKERGISWSLTLAQYTELTNQPCYYCANKLGEPTKIACGLDRLNSGNGYAKVNVVSCCSVCNVIKGGKLTPEETKVAVKAIVRYRKANGITEIISSTSKPRKKKLK